jgi:hypothetical protein
MVAVAHEIGSVRQVWPYRAANKPSVHRVLCGEYSRSRGDSLPILRSILRFWLLLRIGQGWPCGTSRLKSQYRRNMAQVL